MKKLITIIFLGVALQSQAVIICCKVNKDDYTPITNSVVPIEQPVGSVTPEVTPAINPDNEKQIEMLQKIITLLEQLLAKYEANSTQKGN